LGTGEVKVQGTLNNILLGGDQLTSAIARGAKKRRINSLSALTCLEIELRQCCRFSCSTESAWYKLLQKCEVWCLHNDFTMHI